jgi:hypothetical protein
MAMPLANRRQSSMQWKNETVCKIKKQLGLKPVPVSLPRYRDLGVTPVTA